MSALVRQLHPDRHSIGLTLSLTDARAEYLMGLSSCRALENWASRMCTWTRSAYVTRSRVERESGLTEHVSFLILTTSLGPDVARDSEEYHDIVLL